MTKLFTDILIEGEGIYTLCGSKPITRIVVVEGYSEEEYDEYYNSLSKEEITNARIIENYDLPNNLQQWAKIKDQFPMRRFLLFQHFPPEDPDISYLYLVNIFQTACLIQNNYQDFKTIVGFDFDPPSIVYEIQDPQSPFWNKVFNNQYLVGVLFGYGKMNARAFSWLYNHQKNTDFLKPKSSRRELKGVVHRSIKNLQIPAFMSFSYPDEVILQYERERKQIMALYQKNDFLDLSLKYLLE